MLFGIVTESSVCYFFVFWIFVENLFLFLQKRELLKSLLNNAITDVCSARIDTNNTNKISTKIMYTS